jgi:hypothetical protein
MNSRNILLVGLLALLPVVFWWFVFRDDGSMAGYQLPPEAGGPSVPAASTPGAAPSTSAVASVGQQGRFQAAEVDMEELKEAVRLVEFDYDLKSEVRNPLTPLVGERTLGEVAMGPDGTPMEPEGSGIDLAILAHNMRLTATVVGRGMPVAVLQETTVTEGYTFPSGITVSSIEEGRVMLQVGTDEIPVELKEQ